MCVYNAECKSDARLDGKTAIVTGANTGIGKSTAQDLYTRGARVLIACRNLKKASRAIVDIKESCKHLEHLGMLLAVELDLASLKSVRNCAGKLSNSEKKIDILINNAGVMMCPESRTEDGFEMQMGTNHLGHFLFTMLLMPKICQSAPARIVNVSSMVHNGDRIDLDDLNWEKKKYNAYKAYQQSKLANVLFTNELAHKLTENGINNVTTYVLHPGVIDTDISRHFSGYSWILGLLYHYFSKWVLKTPHQGAQTTIFCAVDETCASQSGLYYAECALKMPSKAALNEKDARNLWDISWKMVALDKSYDPFENSILNVPKFELRSQFS